MPKGKKELVVEYTCPLGSECEEIKDNKIYRCMWYTMVAGTDPNKGKLVEDWTCAISWMPTLQIEMANTNRGQTAALESFRNETVKGQTEFNKLVGQTITPNLNHKKLSE